MIRVVVLVALSLTAAVAWADHDVDCTPGGADPATYNVVDAGGERLYLEEREVQPPADTTPPIPGSGHVLGHGTWGYQETNGVPGLQRGGCGGVPSPGVGAGHSVARSCWPICVGDLLCLFFLDPINDENCGHGSDTLRV